MARAAQAETLPPPPQVMRGGQSKRLAYIDVLRAVAIATVVLHHLPTEFGLIFGRLQELGGRGVDLFFALSGYLIGTTCLDRAVSGASRARQTFGYWLLRTARIWPPYFLLLAVLAMGLPTFNPAARAWLVGQPLPYLTFTSNYFLQETLELGVLWSLAIEEQFYFAIGILILLCSQRRETLAAAFIGIALMAIAVAVRYRYEVHALYLKHAIGEPEYIATLFFSTLSRMDQLAVGLVSAVAAKGLNRWLEVRPERYPRLMTWAGIAACLAFLVLSPRWPVSGFTLLGIGFSASVLWAQRPAAQSVGRSGFEGRVVRIVGNVGKLSYGLYLIHPVTRHWMLLAFSRWGIPLTSSTAAIFFVPWFLLTWGLAAISYQWFESPFLKKARDTVRHLLVVRSESTGQA